MESSITYTEENITHNSECQICMNYPIVLPIIFTCGHRYCMRCCFNHNKNGPCNLCKQNHNHKNNLSGRKNIQINKSPVFYLPHSTDINNFYSLFSRGSLVKTTSRQELLEKEIIITKDFVPEGKQDIFRQTIIGLCISINDNQYVIENGFVFNRLDMKLYPTFPVRMVYDFESDDIMYYVSH